MRNRIRRGAGLLMLAFAAVPAGLWADDGARKHERELDHEQVHEAVRAGRILPLDQVLRRVARDFDAPVIGVEFEVKDDVWIYEVVLMGPDGHVVEVYVDAATGRLLKVKREGRTKEH